MYTEKNTIINSIDFELSKKMILVQKIDTIKLAQFKWNLCVKASVILYVHMFICSQITLDAYVFFFYWFHAAQAENNIGIHSSFSCW